MIRTAEDENEKMLCKPKRSLGQMSRRNFVDLSYVLNHLPCANVTLQPRPKKWMFGTLNYGEVESNWFNRADGDRWDIFAPGYESTIAAGSYRCTSVLGVFILSNGNHKIAVRIDHPGFSQSRSRSEVRRYVQQYCKRMGLAGSWCSLTS